MNVDKIIQRVKALLTSPKTEWPVIAAEPTTIADLFKGYAMILAAIPAICVFLKFSVFGMGAGFVGTYRIGVGAGLSQLLISYVLSLVAIYIAGLIIEALAPRFGGQKDRLQAMKTAVYSNTAGWVAGFGFLIPGIGTLIVLAGAVYGIYLLYLGLPHTMKSSAEKTGGYTAAIVIVSLILFIIAGYLTSSVTGMGMRTGAG